MEPPFPSYTKVWHNKPYDSISPSRPELSAAGKTIAITGGGQGIGRAIGLAFAEAGAAHVALLSRRTAALNESKELLSKAWPVVKVSLHSVDITDERGLKEAASAIGHWDVLVANAGVLQTPPARALEGSIDEWWRIFEVNTKGTMMTIRAFLSSGRPEAKVIGVTSAAFVFPSVFLAGTSSYNISKLAQAKALEFLAAEYPDLFIGIFSPGYVLTEMVHNSGVTDVPIDEPELGANFAVWMASPEAAFTRGKLLYANFDVNELKAQAEHIKTSADLTVGLRGVAPLQM